MKTKLLIITNILSFSLFLFLFFREKYPTRIARNYGYAPHNFKTPEYLDILQKWDTIHWKGEIAFLGNSFTGNWVQYGYMTHRDSLIVQGISGDIAAAILYRLRYLLKLKPKICFLEAGFNDIRLQVPLSEYLRNMEQIITILQKNDTKVVLTATFYTSPEWQTYKKYNKLIKKYNEALADLAQKYKIEVIDINPFITEKETLLSKYSIDGVHLTADAYAIWAEHIRKALEKYQL